MLLESRLYSFIDQTNGFTLHFLEGQKLVHDIAITHSVTGEGFHFFRNILLSTQLLISYLKPNEGLGVYIDSEEPYFRFKIEMNESGQMRTLLLPEEIKIFPTRIKGNCRLAKLSPLEKAPYNSIIELNNLNLSEVVNELLKVSYQLNSQIFLSDDSDQAIMISKLPSIDINRVQTNYTLSINEYWDKYQSDFLQFFKKFTADYAEIQTFFESKGLLLLASKEVKFNCTCSRERMFTGLWNLVKSQGLDHVFLDNENELDAKCDYCKKTYTFSRKEFFS